MAGYLNDFSFSTYSEGLGWNAKVKAVRVKILPQFIVNSNKQFVGSVNYIFRYENNFLKKVQPSFNVHTTAMNMRDDSWIE